MRCVGAPSLGAGIPPPPQHVADSWQSADFYANKLLMESRAGTAPPGAAEAAIAWVKAFKVRGGGGPHLSCALPAS